jgi:hypothetical protein
MREATREVTREVRERHRGATMEVMREPQGGVERGAEGR